MFLLRSRNYYILQGNVNIGHNYRNNHSHTYDAPSISTCFLGCGSHLIEGLLWVHTAWFSWEMGK